MLMVGVWPSAMLSLNSLTVLAFAVRCIWRLQVILDLVSTLLPLGQWRCESRIPEHTMVSEWSTSLVQVCINVPHTLSHSQTEKKYSCTKDYRYLSLSVNAVCQCCLLMLFVNAVCYCLSLFLVLCLFPFLSHLAPLHLFCSNTVCDCVTLLACCCQASHLVRWRCWTP